MNVPGWLEELAEQRGDMMVIEGGMEAGWISWAAGEKVIVLDGEFSLQQLREIVRMMEGSYQQPANQP